MAPWQAGTRNPGSAAANGPDATVAGHRTHCTRTPMVYVLAAVVFAAVYAIAWFARRQYQRPPAAGERRPRYDEADCSICMDAFRFRIEANCGHSFCHACFAQVVASVGPAIAVACPLCRREVTFVDELFSPDERTSAASATLRTQALQFIGTFNERHRTGRRGLFESIRDAPMLLRHLLVNMYTPNALTLLTRLRFLALGVVLLLYLISPFDIISEGVFGLLGLADDVLVLVVVLLLAASQYRQERRGPALAR